MPHTMPGAEGEPEPLLRMDLRAEVFASNWAYCDRISSYVARMVSHNRTDSLLHANLFSSALNELLETVFRFHAPGGDITCRILRAPHRDRIELTIPCEASQAEFYHEAVKRLDRADLVEAYRSALFSEGPLDPGIGLLELAVDYGARLRVEPADERSVRLTADLAFEDAWN